MKVLFKDDEYWWGAVVTEAYNMPITKDSFVQYDITGMESFSTHGSNQTAPLFLSNKGRYIWSDTPFIVTIKDGVFDFNVDNLEINEDGKTLKDAYLNAMKKHFPFENKVPPKDFFVSPQYNTWIELMYEQNQEDILRYARDIINNGFKPGILIIDEGWHEPYGNWTFHTGKFVNPRAMVDELHRLGFKVMLWIVPFISPDSGNFRKLQNDSENEHLVRLENGKPALFHWWNGYSFALDMTKKCDRDFLDEQLIELKKEYNIDGFKFDGGNIDSYAHCCNGEISKSDSAAERNIAWNDFGRKYDFHEFKDTYNCGGKCIVQRLRDKFHTWGTNGLAELIPGGIVQGLLGYPYICPDMIGGGDYISFLDRNFKFDEELYIRMAQCSTFFPMMQFSKLPWCALDENAKEIVYDFSELHSKFSDYIYKQVNNTAQTGEPIIRCMEYEFPGLGYETIKDQFMVGDSLLVAPMLKKGVYERVVQVPPGDWTDDNGTKYTGPCTVNIDVPLNRLPFFVKNSYEVSE